MFGESARTEIINDAEGAIGRLLIPMGFERTGRCEWRRANRWKVEEVVLGPKRSGFALNPSLRVLLPLPEPRNGEEMHYVAHANVDGLLRPGQNPRDTRVASLRFGAGRFVRKLVTAVETSMRWFDQFETPHSFRENLDWHLARGCTAYNDAMAHLDSEISLS
ncbi:MAG: hypothetical protein QNK04_27675 [Myxococcota bacterium]|nr:hypothetical protein [Myxococcota bacterium]